MDKFIAKLQTLELSVLIELVKLINTEIRKREAENQRRIYTIKVEDFSPLGDVII